MNNIGDFLQENWSYVNAGLITFAIGYIRFLAKSIIRKIDLMRINVEAANYASGRVNGKFREYSEEWQELFNNKKQQLMKDYEFTFKL